MFSVDDGESDDVNIASEAKPHSYRNFSRIDNEGFTVIQLPSYKSQLNELNENLTLISIIETLFLPFYLTLEKEMNAMRQARNELEGIKGKSSKEECKYNRNEYVSSIKK